MSWKISFRSRMIFHDATQVFIQNCGMLIFFLLVFCALIPVSTAGLPGSSIFNVDYTHDQMKFRFFAANFVPAVNAAAVLYGWGLGLALYRFMLDKKQATAFFSLGLRRSKLFLVRYAVGFLMLAVGLFIPMIVSLFLNVAALGFYPGLISNCCYTGAGLFLLSLIAFTLGTMGCCLAGTMFEAAVFSSALLLAPTLLCYSVNIFLEQLLWGNAFGAVTYSGKQIYPGLVSLLAPANPLLFFWQPSKTSSMFYRSLTGAWPPPVSWWLLVSWGAVTVALAFMAIWLLNRRKAEQADFRGLNPGFQMVVIFLCCFSLSGIALRFAAAYSLQLAYVAIFVVTIGCYVLLRCTLFPHRSDGVINMLCLSGQVLVTAVVVVVMVTGGFGYSWRIPGVDQVRSVTFSYDGSPDYLSGDITGSSSGQGYYVAGLYTYDQPQDIQTVEALQKKLSIAVRLPLMTNANDFADTVLPYDIQINYQLKNGSHLVRYYDRASLTQLTDMLKLDDTEQVRKAMATTIMGLKGGGAASAYRSGQIFLSDSWYDQPYAVTLSSERRRQLLTAIAADVAGQSWQQRYFPRQPPIGVIMFSQDGADDSASFAYNLENSLVYLTDSFNHTLAFLDENGLRHLLDFNGKIERITLQKYDPYGVINGQKAPLSSYFMAYRSGSPDSYLVEKDYGLNVTITDQGEIAKLMPLLQNDYFMNDSGYLAAVKLAGADIYVYKYLPAALAPGYIKRKCAS